MKTLPFRSTGVLLLAAMVLCTDVRAQTAPVNVGDRIRVRLAPPDSGPDRHSRRQELRGTVTAISANDVAFQVHPDASPLTLPFSAMHRLDVSKGFRSRAHNALVLGSLGLLTGGAAWYYENSFRDSPIFADDWEAAFIGAAVGAVTGAVIGVFTRQERWRKLKLPQLP